LDDTKHPFLRNSTGSESSEESFKTDRVWIQLQVAMPNDLCCMAWCCRTREGKGRWSTKTASCPTDIEEQRWLKDDKGINGHSHSTQGFLKKTPSIPVFFNGVSPTKMT